MSDNIRVQDSGGIRTITLDRPSRKNALTQAMYDALARSFRAADEAEDVRIICLTGGGATFCSGNDLDELAANPPPSGRTEGLGGLFAAMSEMRKPIVGSVSGAAVGIGAVLLLHCDLVYAAQTARFRLPFVNLGLVPVGGTSRLLSEKVGPRRARELLYFGDWIDAATAREWGLINGVYPASDLADAVLAKLQQLARKPPVALALTKRLMGEGDTDRGARLDEELRVLRECLGSVAFQDAMRVARDTRPRERDATAGRSEPTEGPPGGGAAR